MIIGGFYFGFCIEIKNGRSSRSFVLEIDRISKTLGSALRPFALEVILFGKSSNYQLLRQKIHVTNNRSEKLGISSGGVFSVD